MFTATTSPTDEQDDDQEPCPGCHQPGTLRWTGSSPSTDTWRCRGCGTTRTITVELPGQVR
jgi:ribosomal protein L37AE/L43A